MKSGDDLPTGIFVSTGGVTVLQAASTALNTNTSQIDLFIASFFISLVP
jgi:hypothetical protein